MWVAYEDQCRVQILIIFLNELSVVVFCFLAIRSIELCPIILHDWQQVFFLAAGGFNGALERREVKLTRPLAVQFVPHFHSPSNFLGSSCDRRNVREYGKWHALTKNRF